ncbi:four helix bundle protein [Nonlabens sp.]
MVTNTREAQRGVSTKDFKNKFGIALKESDETMYW